MKHGRVETPAVQHSELTDSSTELAVKKTTGKPRLNTTQHTLKDHKTFYLSHNKEKVHIAKMRGAIRNTERKEEQPFFKLHKHKL